MNQQYGTKPVNERSACMVTATFLNTSQVPTAPSSARYRIDDITYHPRRSTEILGWTAISTPGTSETITVTATQNKIIHESNNREKKMVTVEATDSGGNIFRQCFIYDVINFEGTP